MPGGASVLNQAEEKFILSGAAGILACDLGTANEKDY